MARAIKLRVAAWVLGGILGAIVLLVALLHTPPVRRYALRQAVEILGNQGITFGASDIDYNLLALRATLNKVEVRSPQQPHMAPLLRAEKVDVDLSLRKLIQGKYYIENAYVRNPDLHLIIEKDGTDNIPRPPKKDDKPSQTVDYLIDQLTIDGGGLRVEDRRQSLDASLPLEKLTVDGDPLTGNHQIDLRAREGGRVALETRSMPLTGVVASVLLEEDAADVKKFEVGLGESKLNLGGRINNFKDPRFDVRADTTLALGSLVELAGVEQTIRGNVHVAVTATGPVSQLKATARVEGQDLTVDRFTKLDIKGEAEYDTAAARVNVKSLNVVSPAGTIRGNANLALNSTAGQSTANIATRGLDLGSLTATLKAPVRIASRMDANIEAGWPALEFEKAGGNATIHLAATRRDPARDVVPISGDLNVRTSGNRVVLGIQRLQTLNASAAGTVTVVNRNGLSGRVQLTSNSLGATLSSAERYLGRNITDTPVEGKATIVADLGGTIKNPAVATLIEAPELQLGELRGVNIRANSNYNGTQLALKDANLTWRGQTITASGTVGLKGRNRAINLRTHSDNLQIQSVLAGLGKTDIPASGDVQIDATVTGSTSAPIIDARVSGSNVVAYNETLGTLNAEARVRGDIVEIPTLTLDKPQEGGNGTLQAAATYNLETKSFTLDAQSRDLRLTSLTLPNGMPVRGELQLNAKASGTAEDPAGTLALAARDLRVGDNTIGALNVDGTVQAGVANVTAAAPAYNLTANARVATKAPYPATVEVRADNTDIATLPVKIDQPVKGTVSAVARFTGELSNYDRGQGSAEISALNLDVNGQPLRTDGPLVASYANQRLTIDRATVIARDSRVSLSGTLPLDPAAGQGEIRIAANLDLPTLVQYVPDAGVTAQGTATINGTVRGTLKRIDPDITLAVNNGYIHAPKLNPPVSGLNVQARIRDGALELQSANADIGPAVIAASGTVPFGILPANLPFEMPRRQGPAQFTAELRDLDLATLEGLPDEVAGVVSARIDARADRPELEALNATLTLPKLSLQYGTIVLDQKGTSEIALANGVARVSNFGLTGTGTDINLTGTAALTGDRALNLRLDGSTNVGLLAAFTDAVRAEGDAEVRVAVTGTVAQPQAAGYIQLADANVSLREPRVGLENLNVRVDLAGTRATISQLTGTLNGGDVSGGGTIELAKGQLANTNITLKAAEVYLDVPEGLKTVSDIDLNVRNAADGTVTVGGRVVIRDGGFTDDLNFDRGLLAALDTSRGVDLTEERNPMLENIRFNINVRTDNPIIINNNLAEAEITADLQILGTPYQPGLAGRLEIAEGGRLRLQEREYSVERGVITFLGERRIEPMMDIAATTRAGGYDVRLQITGEPGKTETTLTSDPSLPEPDILALLLTGRTMDEIRGQEFEVARNQVLSYLTGRVGGQIGRGIAGATGLSTVRIEPNLIAAETDPSARLTVGQDITRNLELIYSMDLINSSDQIYVAEYDITKRFTTRGVRQADGSFRMDFRHDLRLGGTPEPRRGVRRQDREIGAVNIVGERYFDELKIADKLDVKPGKKYDFFKVRKGLDRVEKMYTKANLLESRIRLRREEQGDLVNLNLNVTPGPVVDFVFEGTSVPGDVQKRVREIWRDGVFDTQRAEESVEAIRTHLVKENRLRPEIEYAITNPGTDRKRVVFDIQPGPVFRDVELAFDGAKSFEEKDLRNIVEKQKLETEVYTAPGRVTELLQAYYRENGFLDAEVANPRYELDAQKGTGRVVFPVTEGPEYKVGRVAFEGNTVYSDDQLTEFVPLPIGEVYRPVLRQNALERLRQSYWDIGFNDVDTDLVMRRSKEEGTVDITFKIAENRQAVVRELIVEGNQNTSDRLIRTQLVLEAGDVLDFRRLAESRRNLYNTGAYSLVEVVREEIGAETGEQTRARQEGPPGIEKPMRITVRVREIQPYEVRYGGFFDTERGPGAILDLSNRNSLGSARVLGLRTRYDSQLQEARLYFSQPLLRRFPVKTIASPFYRRERNPATEQADPFNVDTIGFSLQQEANWQRRWVLNYGYRIEKSRTYDPAGGDPLFDVPLRIGALTSTLTRETRDEIMDATRGSFMSQALQWSPEVLGSELRFIKYFGQYFKYIPLQKPRIEMFTNKVERPRLVYAGGVRVGLAKGFGGQEVPLKERFFAGGGTTIRGFEQNSIGPVGGDRTPRGGEGMLVVNNELRFPLISIFDGVGFVDIGNVYERVSDFSFSDIRKTGGVGLRVRTPWFLIRMDYGVKLDRRADESRGRLFFSIGQAF